MKFARRQLPSTVMVAGTLLFFAFIDSLVAVGQPTVSVVSRISTSGTITEIHNDQFTIVDSDGKTQTFKIQVDPEQMISVDRGQVPLKQPANILVQGRAESHVLVPGMKMQIEADVIPGSRPDTATRIEILTQSQGTPGVTIESKDDDDPQKISAIGTLTAATPKRLTLELPRGDLAPRGKLVFEAEDIPVITFSTESFSTVKRGDVVTSLDAFELSTGELVVEQIKVDLVGIRDSLELTLNEALKLRYFDKDDSSVAPRQVSSKHFVLQTDISEREALVLLDKLEVMLELVSGYYGKRVPAPIPCVVVENLSRWDSSEFEPFVIEKIQENTGLTVYQAVGNNRQAVVYSAARHDVVQHEAVHAYCFLTFGSTGPLWYAEGMAEMGQYWAPGTTRVVVEPAVIDYLTESEPQEMLQIIRAERIDGEAWKAYAWRWALCHLLLNNPNYEARFKRLGLALLNERRETFETTFGDLANQISFEYDLFVKNFGNGYQVDLTAWDWTKKPRTITSSRSGKATVAAAMGWQPTTIQLKAGTTYEIKVEGTWQVEPDADAVTAAGDENGLGRLVGAIFSEFELSDEFELGGQESFVAPVDGQLALRCNDSWLRLSDNQGEVTVTISKN